MVSEFGDSQYIEFKPQISPLRRTRPRPSMVLFRPLAHAILHDARDVFHSKQCFIQTRTTGTRERREQPHTRGARTKPRPARARRRKLLPLPPARRPQQPELVARRLDQGRFSVVDCPTRPRPRTCATMFPTQLAQNNAANKRRIRWSSRRRRT